MFPYDTILGKDRTTVEREIEQFVTAIDVTLDRAVEWLLEQCTSDGPVMREPSVSLVYKTVWALSEVGGQDEAVTTLLDWIGENALRSNGDLFFSQEPAVERDGLRIYRAAIIMRAASQCDHPLASDPRIRERLCQYQSSTAGGVFAYIGENPASPQFPDDCNVGDSSFFGEYAIAAGERERATAVGNWMVSLIQQNAPAMRKEGRFYWHTTADGRLVTAVAPGEEFDRMVSVSTSNQAGWALGCTMAFLADLYQAMRTLWGTPEEKARVYLEHALEVLKFEDLMPVETYYYPSKCKVAWGVGRVLTVLLDHGLASEDLLDALYRIGKRTYLHTFLGCQLFDGSWSHAFYPLSTLGPEIQLDYRSMNGVSAIPAPEIYEESASSFVLSAVEITSEFVAEMCALAQGIGRLQEEYRALEVAAPA